MSSVTRRATGAVLVGLLATGVSLTAHAAPGDNDLIQPEGELPVVIAHRGYSSILPENTLLSEVAAMKLGAEYFEIDVHTTADGVPMILHDDTLDRTTDGTGPLNQSQSAAVSALDAGSWKDPAYAGEPVPTLEELLTAMAHEGNGGTLMMEIKGDQTREQVYAMLDLVVEHGMNERTAVESFNFAVVGFARDYNEEHGTDIPLGLLVGEVGEDPVADAQRYGATMYNPSSGVTAEVVDELHAAGIAVMPWTINDAATWQRLSDAGVDGIVTDKPGMYLGWRIAQSVTAELPQAGADPDVQIIGLEEGQQFSSDDIVIIAAATENATTVDYALDGRAVEPGTMTAAEIGGGNHTLTVTVTGDDGEASAEVTFTVS